MNIGKQIKKLCKENDITVSQLSRATKIPLPTLNHIVNGRPPRKLEHIKQLCTFFKCSSDFLLFDSEAIQTAKGKSDTSFEELVQFGRYDVFLRKVESK
jgi:transcriptional regulator with XRE-family HTH domain